MKGKKRIFYFMPDATSYEQNSITTSNTIERKYINKL